MADYSNEDYVRKGHEHRSAWMEDGKRRRDAIYDLPKGPSEGVSTNLIQDQSTGQYIHNQPKIKTSVWDAATHNIGENLMLPGSAKGFSADGRIAQWALPNSSDPKQTFPFYFKSVDILSYNFGNIPLIGELDFSINEVCTFQATLKDLNESLSPTYSDKTYFGRSEPIRVYRSTSRSISMAFTIYASSFATLQHLKERVNFLIKSCYPTYEGSALGGMVDAVASWAQGEKLNAGKQRYKEPPIMMLTIGDMFKDLPGVITSCTVDWLTAGGRWELEPGARMPQACEVSLDYTVMHDKVPQRTVGADFYPGLKVDELHSTQGDGGRFSRGAWMEGFNEVTADMDDGLTISKLKKLGRVLSSMKSWSRGNNGPDGADTYINPNGGTMGATDD